MRLIDADALMENLKSIYTNKENEAKYTGQKCIDVTWDDACTEIKNSETVAYGQQWIPCDKELPTVGEPVLFSVDGLYVSEGCLMEDGDWCQFVGSITRRKDMVDAWCPLPDPYVEEVK